MCSTVFYNKRARVSSVPRRGGHRQQRQSEGKFPCQKGSHRGWYVKDHPRSNSGVRSSMNTFWFRAIKPHKGRRFEKARKKDERLIRLFLRGERRGEEERFGSSDPFFAEESGERGGHVGSPQPFSGTRGQKRRVRAPFSVKNRF